MTVLLHCKSFSLELVEGKFINFFFDEVRHPKFIFQIFHFRVTNFLDISLHSLFNVLPKLVELFPTEDVKRIPNLLKQLIPWAILV